MPEKLLTDVELNVSETFEKIKAAAVSVGRDPSEIRLMAVTKTVSPDKVNEAIVSGCDLLGENRVQELLEKYESYDKNAEIHFIGSLQTNKDFPHLRLRGLMTIGRFGAEIEETRQYFQKMRHLLVDIKSKNIDNIYINILSMGMSSDYELAVTEGANIVRVGRGLFGERKYNKV